MTLGGGRRHRSGDRRRDCRGRKYYTHIARAIAPRNRAECRFRNNRSDYRPTILRGGFSAAMILAGSRVFFRSPHHDVRALLTSLVLALGLRSWRSIYPSQTTPAKGEQDKPITIRVQQSAAEAESTCCTRLLAVMNGFVSRSRSPLDRHRHCHGGPGRLVSALPFMGSEFLPVFDERVLDYGAAGSSRQNDRCCDVEECDEDARNESYYGAPPGVGIVCNEPNQVT